MTSITFAAVICDADEPCSVHTALWSFFRCSCGNSGFKHGSVIVYNIFAYFTLSLNTPQVHMIKERCWFFPNRLLYWVLSTSDQDFVSFQPILCHPHTQIRIILFHDVQRDIPNSETFSQPYFNRIFSNCLCHNSPSKGWPDRFRSRGTTESSILDHDFGHLCRGRRIQISGHSDFGIFSNVGASSIFVLGVNWYCVCCLSCASWWPCHDIHFFCSRHFEHH